MKQTNGKEMGLSLLFGRGRRRPKKATSEAVVNLSAVEDMHYACAIRCRPTESTFSGVVVMILSIAIVMLQLLAGATLQKSIGNMGGHCQKHDDCGRALWCSKAPHPNRNPVLKSGICLKCAAVDFCTDDGTGVPVLPASTPKEELFANDWHDPSDISGAWAEHLTFPQRAPCSCALNTHTHTHTPNA
jgi:hypothetical protein